jgi:hypothetical protein
MISTCFGSLPILRFIPFAAFLIISATVFAQLAYAHDSAIGVRLNLSIRIDIVDNGTTHIGPFQIKLTDQDTGLMDVKQHNPDDVQSGTTFNMSLPNVEIGDKLQGCIQRYDTSDNVCQSYTVMDQDFEHRLL